MLRWLIRALAILVIAVAALVVLDFAELLVPVEPDDRQSMANTIPACDGRVLAQGLTYRLWPTRARPRRRRARRGDGRRRASCPTTTPTTGARPARGRRTGRRHRGPRRNGLRQRGEVRRHHDRAVPAGHRPERAVLPARRQPLGGDRQPYVRAGARERDLRDACSPSSGRFATSRSVSARAPATAWRDRLRLTSRTERRFRTLGALCTRLGWCA